MWPWKSVVSIALCTLTPWDAINKSNSACKYVTLIALNRVTACWNVNSYQHFVLVLANIWFLIKIGDKNQDKQANICRRVIQWSISYISVCRLMYMYLLFDHLLCRLYAISGICTRVHVYKCSLNRLGWMYTCKDKRLAFLSPKQDFPYTF